jgi:hypothetical protein
MHLMSSAAADMNRQFRVPQETGKALIDPPLDRLRGSIRPIDADTALSGLEFCGQPISKVRREARREAVELAQRYSGQYRDLPSQSNSVSDVSPILLAGHQPELFHPGVWFKNFLLSNLAVESGAVAINFLVDNDLCRNTAIRVPTRTKDGTVIATSIPFDAPRDSIPWELRLLNDVECWRQFPTVVRKTLLPEIDRPLVDDLWQYASDSVARTGRIGYAVAEGRHRLESEIGLQTLEVPLSQLVSTLAFARFSVQLLSELPRLQATYNAQRESYRAAHHIRSHAHPVPPLEQQDDWLEAPWWVYRLAAPKRQRLWVKLIDNSLMLSDRAGWQTVIEGRLECDQAAAQWLDILSDGVCLRPRALLTTMYFRLIVGDAFIHGIGGGKYDQLTDAIIQEYFGVTPPDVIVASATLRLPIALNDEVATDSSTQQREKLWQLRFHAESAVGIQNPQTDAVAANPSEVEALAARKRELLAKIPQRGDKWEWHHQITTVNRRLAELAAAQTAATRQQLDLAMADERQRRILASREFSFCLFDRQYIANELHRMAAS